MLRPLLKLNRNLTRELISALRNPKAMSTDKEHFDDDGNKISKNAHKKLQKLKSLKEQCAEPKEELSATEFFENRVAMVREMRENGEDPYPHKFDTTLDGRDISVSLPQFLETYGDTVPDRTLDGETVCLMGRVKLIRSHGAKLFFAIIEADGAELQLVANQSLFASAANFAALRRRLQRGDLLGARGSPGRSRSGELSLFARSLQLLAPCLRALPSFKYGLKDTEARFRQRYLDLLLDPARRETFYTRAAVVAYVRRFLDARGFLEVETPVLNLQPGGANARPFATHHNDLGQPMFLRVAPELFLKQLVVGGLGRVYEIGRQFRNEGVDPSHNPEFTTCEFYWAYRDCADLLAETEALLGGLVAALKGGPAAELRGRDGRARRIDFAPPFRRVDFLRGIEEAGGFRVPRPLAAEATREFLRARLLALGLPEPAPPTAAKLLDKLCEHLVESRIEQPTFVLNHPALLSPLAKAHREDAELTERFELFVCGKELCNSFTELNDPAEQRRRFEAQARDKSLGDDESMSVDEGFLAALEYGLPPTAGWGFGIDRFTMLMTDSANIKEVLLFPTLRPEKAAGPKGAENDVPSAGPQPEKSDRKSGE